MTDSPIQQFATHPYRNWLVGGVSLVLLLAFGLPAYDDYCAANQRRHEVLQDLTKVSRSIANMPHLQSRLVKVSETMTEQCQTVNPSTALKLREQVVGLIQHNNCRLLKVQLGDPQSSPWQAGDDPLSPPTLETTDDKVFNLVTTKLNVSAEGSLTQLDKLIQQLTELHQLAVPAQLEIKRDGNREFLQLDIELSLLDLQPKVGPD